MCRVFVPKQDLKNIFKVGRKKEIKKERKKKERKKERKKNERTNGWTNERTNESTRARLLDESCFVVCRINVQK